MALDFLKKFFGSGGSKNIARERLQIVLIHDRADISPAMLEDLRRDMIGVITRYMDIDTSKIEMDFDRADRSVAFVANIPVIRIKRGVGAKEQETVSGGKKTQSKRKSGKA
ncbi:MAG: cell division topological specificity factor MinE [Synergistaceae bacterium]|jgi:cell division topological specificity factor|nr:cell division topological specificity factor MinE [Synergistaceae bacterium]